MRPAHPTPREAPCKGHRPHLVFLFSDTGGGHRSAAQAILEALHSDYPQQTTHALVDFFRAYAPPPLSRIPDLFPPLARYPALLGLIFAASDGPSRTRLNLALLWPFIRQSLSRLLSEHPADLYVSVHPLITAPLGRALQARGSRTPLVTVVTDLVSAHATWYCPRSNLVIVPTQAAYQRGLRSGFPPQRMRVVGLPVSPQYARLGSLPPLLRTQELRAQLGWPAASPIVLLVGGGEGMGPLERIAQAIDAARLPIFLVIVAGRNAPLQRRLAERSWRTPVQIYGFVQQMPQFLFAADILVTKAGPGAISEALAAGLPLLLYSRLNGSEDGNVDYVVNNHAGVWAPQPQQLVRALRAWLDHPEQRLRVARTCRSLARPQAASEISHLLAEQVQITPCRPTPSS